MRSGLSGARQQRFSAPDLLAPGLEHQEVGRRVSAEGLGDVVSLPGNRGGRIRNGSGFPAKGSLLVHLTPVVAFQEALDELPDLSRSGRVEILAGILEPVAHLTIQSQYELSVFLILLLLFLVRH